MWKTRKEMLEPCMSLIRGRRSRSGNGSRNPQQAMMNYVQRTVSELKDHRTVVDRQQRVTLFARSLQLLVKLVQ